MWSMISSFIPKGYLVIGAVLIIVSTFGYIKYLQSDSEDKDIKLSAKDEIIKSKNADIENIIEGYEKTLAIEKEIASQKAITQEQKEVVVTKYKTLTKTIEKRGVIKQDEKSNFNIVTF